MDCLPNEPPGCDYRSLLFFSGYLYCSPRFKPLSRLLSHLSLLVYPSWSLPVPFCSAFCFSCSSLVSLFSFWSCFLPLVSFKPTKGHKNEALHGHGSVESGQFWELVMWRLFVFGWCQKTSLFGGCCLLLWRLPPPHDYAYITAFLFSTGFTDKLTISGSLTLSCGAAHKLVHVLISPEILSSTCCVHEHLQSPSFLGYWRITRG